jgi:hypothetical protein
MVTSTFTAYDAAAEKNDSGGTDDLRFSDTAIGTALTLHAGGVGLERFASIAGITGTLSASDFVVV